MCKSIVDVLEVGVIQSADPELVKNCLKKEDGVV